ncbi:MAG TPA: RdgB/HAM1 family non-canonical purine NTP pyrophosphatase [Candidatus Sphingobacterium stercorigallinarum]|nr:RdgB/HAM1 family non-canonical purine NTP pyrophosphatase [Candidatus Sphingobacterium stercorigallinarum]
MELVFATHNQHKLEEVQSMLGSKVQLKSLTDINLLEDIPETGTTFEENARQKTDYLIQRDYAVACFGDDSGLEIAALQGEPGVYSARYSGTRDMERNIDLVLEKMKGVSNRRAQFKTVISLYIGGDQYFFEGIIEGVITLEKRGEKGFGYDPIFIPHGHDRTFAEMDLAEKNRMSHRAIAIQKLTGFLQSREAN